MSNIQIEDAGWKAIMADPELAAARRKLSFHEIRLMVNHVRASTLMGHDEALDLICHTGEVLSYQEAIEGYLMLRGMKVQPHDQ